MASITIDVPKGTETKYKEFICAVVQNFSIDDLEDALLGLHVERNKYDDDFVSREEVFNALNS